MLDQLERTSVFEKRGIVMIIGLIRDQLTNNQMKLFIWK